jgi:hypothetical protein
VLLLWSGNPALITISPLSRGASLMGTFELQEAHRPPAEPYFSFAALNAFPPRAPPVQPPRAIQGRKNQAHQVCLLGIVDVDRESRQTYTHSLMKM